MGKAILIAMLFALLGLTIWWAVAGWNVHADVEMSGHGYVAMMALGILFSLVVGAGLMGLVFYSSRRGYDQPAEQDIASAPAEKSGRGEADR